MSTQPEFKNLSLFEMVEAAFDRKVLKRICEMDERKFARAYDMEVVGVAQKAPDNFYAFKDNGSDILAVAHLDTVGLAWQRTARFVDTEDGPVVFSRALDDRLGAYIILELLPALGIQFDILLTVGEENGRSTAGFFEAPKDYNWMIEFDRGGTDVVMYQYENLPTVINGKDVDIADLVKASGARVGEGIFSDICYLEHLGCKGFNWGVGYQDYHGPRAHAFLEDTFWMVSKFLRLHDAIADIHLPHEEEEDDALWWTRLGRWDDNGRWSSIEDLDEPRECDLEFGTHDHDDEECARLLDAMKVGTDRYDPMDDIPAGTPDEWIPDNPNEDGFRQADFI